MKKILLILLLVSLPMVSCDDETPSGPGDTLPGDKLFPLAVGNVWVYRIFDGVNTYTDSIVILTNHSLPLVEQLPDETNIDRGVTSVYGYKGMGRPFRPKPHDGMALLDSGIQECNIDYQNQAEPQKAWFPSYRNFIPKAPRLNAPWQLEIWPGGPTLANEWFDSREVNVPAGTFSNCYMMLQIQERDGTIENETRTYFSAGVGAVKSETEANGTVTARVELLRYTIN